MSTRSHIGVENEDGSVDSIYCHFDGYPSNNGKILLDHYSPDLEQENCNKKIQDLINLGSISFLASEIGEQHDFENTNNSNRYDWVLSYKRDRGDEDADAKHYDNVADFLLNCTENYTYLLGNNGKWKYRAGNGPLKLLTEEVINHNH